MSDELSISMISSDVQPPHIATQQEKLDAIFGITNGKNIDDFLDSLTVEDKSTCDTLSSFDQSMKDKLNELENSSIIMSQTEDGLSVQIATMEHSLKEIEDLVNLSKDVVRHVANSILATPLIDSEAVQAYSKLIESIHVNIAEFIGVYRDKSNFVNKVKYAMFDQQQKKDLLLYKHNLALEMMKAKDGPKNIDADSISTSKEWNVEAITKLMANFSNEISSEND